jgi:hypothetical protein
MPRNGAQILSDFPPDTRFEVTCSRCPRRGVYAAARLMERFGDEGLPNIRYHLSADCPKHGSAGIYDRCDTLMRVVKAVP